MKKVFVSSVIGGFESFRMAAKAAIELMDYKPIMAEQFSSRAYSSETACISEVEKSDIIILILGAKYGFTTSDGISVTQSEYKASQKAKKNVLVFLQDCEMESKQLCFKQDVERYHEGLFRTKFKTEEQLKDLILKALRYWESEQQTVNSDAFLKRLDQVNSNLKSSRNETRAVVTFWGQPTNEYDLDKIEQDADNLFASICKTGAASLRDGYDIFSKADIVTIQSGKTEFSYFSDGLISLSFSSESSNKASSFSSFFVSPQMFKSVALKARNLNQSRIVWVRLGLYGMENRYFDEPPKGSSTSVAMFNNHSSEAVNLFSPITEVSYEGWVDMQVKKFKRVFSNR